MKDDVEDKKYRDWHAVSVEVVSAYEEMVDLYKASKQFNLPYEFNYKAIFTCFRNNMRELVTIGVKRATKAEDSGVLKTIHNRIGELTTSASDAETLLTTELKEA